MKAIVFLGGGRITAAMVAGLRRSDYRGRIIVHDRHGEKLAQFRREWGIATEASLVKAVRAAGILIVAVRPPSVRDLLRGLAPHPSPIVAVSVAAGVPLAALRKWLGSPVKWARAMPSPACRTRHGMTALVFDRNFPRATRGKVRRLFARFGEVMEIPEKLFDAFTVTFSVTHGYHALAALAHAAERIGLPPRVAVDAASHALIDGILALREERISLSHLLAEAATPGGIAAATMKAMDDAGHTRAIERSLRAGLAHARSIAQR